MGVRTRKPIIGKRVCGEPKDERDHFISCLACGASIDMRDLGQVLDHEERCQMPTCYRCHDVAWVCENHPERPWSDDKPGGCVCGAGEPCPDCNGSDGEDDPARTGEVITSIDVTRDKGRLN